MKNRFKCVDIFETLWHNTVDIFGSGKLEYMEPGTEKFSRGKYIRRILTALGMCAYFLTAYIVMSRFGIGCVFRYFFGIPCPGCGMTRALNCLLHLDFSGALKYNVTVFFMPYVFAYIFFDFKSKVHKYILLTIAFVAMMNWGLNVFRTLV